MEHENAAAWLEAQAEIAWQQQAAFTKPPEDIASVCKATFKAGWLCGFERALDVLQVDG